MTAKFIIFEYQLIIIQIFRVNLRKNKMDIEERKKEVIRETLADLVKDLKDMKRQLAECPSDKDNIEAVHAENTDIYRRHIEAVKVATDHESIDRAQEHFKRDQDEQHNKYLTILAAKMAGLPMDKLRDSEIFEALKFLTAAVRRS